MPSQNDRSSSRRLPNPISRRAFLEGSAALCALHPAFAQPLKPVPDTSALRRAVQHSGVLLGTYTVGHELQYSPQATAIINDDFGLIADGNDLKFSNRLRPAPDQYDFSFGDVAVKWAAQHQKKFRGHCLVWHNALPTWFQSYVTPANAKQVMTDHITTVMKHYKGSVYAWDVANEVIHNDGRPDGLRIKPWLSLIGPDYIELAFHTAHAADPSALLVLNENYVEHMTPAEQTRRQQLLALVKRMKQSGVPIDAIGLQSHLRGAVPLDTAGLTDFAKQVRDLGLKLMITELDVDSLNVPPAQVDQVTAAHYHDMLVTLLPYLSSVTLEQTADPAVASQVPNGYARANIFDSQFQPKLAYQAVVQAFSSY